MSITSTFIAGCIAFATQYYGVPEPLVRGLLVVEGGKVGTVSRNTNGTEDLGPMQINTIWIPEISGKTGLPGHVVREKLINDACYNISIGSWILSGQISSAGGDIWKGVGNYHSRTRKHHVRYVKKVVEAVQRLYGHGIFRNN